MIIINLEALRHAHFRLILIIIILADDHNGIRFFKFTFQTFCQRCFARGTAPRYANYDTFAHMILLSFKIFINVAQMFRNGFGIMYRAITKDIR